MDVTPSGRILQRILSAVLSRRRLYEGLDEPQIAERIRDLPGFGKVSEGKILKGIKDLKARSAKFKLSTVEPAGGPAGERDPGL